MCTLTKPRGCSGSPPRTFFKNEVFISLATEHIGAHSSQLNWFPRIILSHSNLLHPLHRKSHPSLWGAHIQQPVSEMYKRRSLYLKVGKFWRTMRTPEFLVVLELAEAFAHLWEGIGTGTQPPLLSITPVTPEGLDAERTSQGNPCTQSVVSAYISWMTWPKTTRFSRMETHFALCLNVIWY